MSAGGDGVTGGVSHAVREPSISPSRLTSSNLANLLEAVAHFEIVPIAPFAVSERSQCRIVVGLVNAKAFRLRHERMIVLGFEVAETKASRPDHEDDQGGNQASAYHFCCASLIDCRVRAKISFAPAINFSARA